VVANVSDEEMQEHYDNFFEDVFVECEDKVIRIRILINFKQFFRLFWQEKLIIRIRHLSVGSDHIS
jgi:hypothetical protein